MSAYEVAKLCRRCLREPELRERVLADPESVLGQFDLTAAERSALLAGEVGELYLRGCSAFLLSYLPRWGVFGLDVPTYATRMRAAAPAAAMDVVDAEGARRGPPLTSGSTRDGR